MKKAKSKILFSFSATLVPVLFCLISCNGLLYAAVAIGTAAIHELGHIAAARALGIDIKSMKLDMLGARLNTDSSLFSYKREFLLCAAGPAANILTVLVCLPFLEYGIIRFAVTSSCMLAVLNLMPIRNFDGGRMLTSLISAVFGIYTAQRVIYISSFICLSCMWIISSYILIRAGASLSVFIFCVSVFSSIFLSENSSAGRSDNISDGNRNAF